MVKCKPVLKPPILDSFRFKTSEKDKFKTDTNNMKIHGRLENIIGKRVNAGYLHLLFFPQCFPKPFQG